jgi:arylsulfatase A-like enzyme
MKILVVEASALHLGFLGCYGNDWVATPDLDRLAAESVAFDQHVADSPEPAAARPPRLRGVAEGRYPFPVPRKATADPAIRFEIIDGLADFAGRTIEAVDRTLADGQEVLWVDGPDLSPPWRLSGELLAVYAGEGGGHPIPEPPVGLRRLDLPEYTRLHDTYAAVVTAFDAQLGAVLDHLRQRGLFDGLLACVTARCGLALAEHGMVGSARAWLHDELVHVPLIVRLPAGEEAGLRIPALTQPVDLVPTFWEFLGRPVPMSHGRSLWPLIRGKLEAVRPYAASGLRVGHSEEWLLRAPDLALLLPISVPAGDPPRQPQLYVKPDDRWEVNDLAPRQPEQAEALEKTLRAFVEATMRPGPLEYPPLPEEVLAGQENAP